MEQIKAIYVCEFILGFLYWDICDCFFWLMLTRKAVKWIEVIDVIIFLIFKNIIEKEYITDQYHKKEDEKEHVIEETLALQKI